MRVAMSVVHHPLSQTALMHEKFHRSGLVTPTTPVHPPNEVALHPVLETLSPRQYLANFMSLLFASAAKRKHLCMCQSTRQGLRNLMPSDIEKWLRHIRRLGHTESNGIHGD